MGVDLDAHVRDRRRAGDSARSSASRTSCRSAPCAETKRITSARSPTFTTSSPSSISQRTSSIGASFRRVRSEWKRPSRSARSDRLRRALVAVDHDRADAEVTRAASAACDRRRWPCPRSGGRPRGRCPSSRAETPYLLDDLDRVVAGELRRGRRARTRRPCAGGSGSGTPRPARSSSITCCFWRVLPPERVVEPVDVVRADHRLVVSPDGVAVLVRRQVERVAGLRAARCSCSR